MRKLRGPSSPWGLQELLLRRIDLHLAGANWQRGGGKGQKPKPIDLPSDKKPRKSTKASGEDVAQRLRNLGLIPAGDAANSPSEQQPAAIDE